jgi:YVTN family beta-propeller protein
MRAFREIEVGEGPFALTLDATNERLFVVNVRSGDISVIDTAKQDVLARVRVGGSPYGVAVDRTSNRILVSNQHGDDISTIRADTLEVIRTIAVGRYPEAVLGIDGRGYVANWFSGDLSILDLVTGREVATLRLGEGPRSMAFTDGDPGETQ